MHIGVISDTHMPGSVRELWPEVAEAFAGVELILHGGDITNLSVLDQLEEIAPVLAARGNNDPGLVDPRLDDAQWLTVDGLRIGMVHDMEPEDEPIAYLRERFLGGRDVDVMITGHTHRERLDYRDGVLQLNAGSAVHPHLWSTRLGTVARLEIGGGDLRARVVRLGEHDGLRNPGVEYEFDGDAVRRLD
ncbi:MAG TPA: metallophosphoesterase family protein [Acidimicrobiia bacterium]|nr:metallophosphoesterase family protein [Acidimicrobiia bacterium]